ncbi:Uma2 family endonuclease [Caulobacter sp. Root342]|uniref:Uma2 family endonuclease n=1 Tax=Caulobacter sp. Root342 TaxID=1736519 RepID=UPI001F428201|nr:Uma2 family endonuclease [Caulobacter sp. Root342]
MHRFKLEDVLRMQAVGILDNADRLELIDGLLLERPSETLAQTRMKAQLLRGLFAAAGDDINVIAGETLKLSPYNAPMPAFFLYDAEESLSSVDALTVGLVIDIATHGLASQSTTRAELYAHHGVRDYWVVDPDHRVTAVHRRPVEGRYREISAHGADDSVQALVLPALSLRLTHLKPIL